MAEHITPKQYSLSKDIIVPFRSAYASHPRRSLVLLPRHIEALNKMSICRTNVLGGVMYVCECCGDVHFINRSCKHRFCVMCGIKDTNRWAQDVLNNLLNIKHSHVVVTLPAWLRGVSKRNGNLLYNLLFGSLKKVILEWFSVKYGVEAGLVMVLHTSGADLKYHPHVHCIVSFGGMELGSKRVQVLDGDFLVNHHFLSRRFRHVFEGGLIEAYDAGRVNVPPHLCERKYFMAFLRRNNREDWIVSIQEPLKDATSIVRYVFRYAKRACVSERKIEKIEGEYITLRYNDYKNTPKGEKPKQGYMTLHYVDFLDRLLQHVPEKGFRQVRYAGIYEGRKRKNLPPEWKLPPQYVADKEPVPAEGGDFWQYRQDTKKFEGHDPLWCETCQRMRIEFAEILPATRPKPTELRNRQQHLDSS